MRWLVWKNYIFNLEKIQNISIDLKTKIDEEAPNMEWKYIEVRINNTVLKIWPEEIGFDEKTVNTLWQEWDTIKNNIGKYIVHELIREFTRRGNIIEIDLGIIVRDALSQNLFDLAYDKYFTKNSS